MFKSHLIIALVGMLSATVVAQTEPLPTPNLTPKSIVGAGFAVEYNGLFDPFATESSNSTLYGLNLQRNSISDGIYTPDRGMSLARLTQTIALLNSVGTIDQLLDATITDANGSLRQFLNNQEFELPESTPCVRTIASAQRTGKRFSVDLNGSPGFVECYAFVDDSGKGIGVTLKYREGIDPTTSIDESALLNDILEDMSIHSLTPDTPYTYLLAQYPIRIPVLSKVEYAKQLNETAVETQVHMQGAILTLQLINIPEQYSTYASQSEQEEAYAKMITEQEDLGVLRKNWAARTHVPAGRDLSDLVEGQVFSYTAGEQTFYNAFYTQLDGNLLLSANFSTSTDAYKQVHKYAKLLFKDSRGASWKSRMHHAFPGFELRLPSGYYCTTPEDPSRFDEYLVSTKSLLSFENKLNMVYQRVPITRFKLFAPGELTNLNDAHLQLVNMLMNRAKSPDDPDKSYAGDPPTPADLTLPDGTLIKALNTSFIPQLSAEIYRSVGSTDTRLSVTSYLIENPHTGITCVASTISNSFLAPSAEDTTIALLGSFTPSTSITEKILGFATLNYDPFLAKFNTNPNERDDGSSHYLSTPNELITIIVSQSNERYEVLSARLLAETHMKPVWERNTFGENMKLFPSDTKELMDVQVAGHNGLLFEKTVTPENTWGSEHTPERRHIRVYGFVHKDRFITISMKQFGDNIDQSKLDDWLDAFTE